MCAPVNGSSKTTYNEKEYNAERNYIEKEDMNVKGILIEKEDVSIYSAANNTGRYISDYSAYQSVQTYAVGGVSTLGVVSAIVDFVVDIITGGYNMSDIFELCKEFIQDAWDDESTGELNDSNEMESSNTSDDSAKDADDSDKKGDTDNDGDPAENNDDNHKEDDDDDDVEDGDVEETENTDKEPDNQESSNKRENENGNKSQNPKDKIESKNDGTKMNNNNVNAFEAFKQRGIIDNIARNVINYFINRAKADIYRMTHPFETAVKTIQMEFSKLLDPIGYIEKSLKNDVNTIKYMFHQQIDPSKVYRRNDMGNQIANELERQKERELGTREEYIQQRSGTKDTRDVTEAEGPQFDKAGLKEKFDRYWELGRKNDEITERYLVQGEAKTFEELCEKSPELAQKVRDEHSPNTAKRNEIVGEIADMLGKDVTKSDGTIDSKLVKDFMKSDEFKAKESELFKEEKAIQKAERSFDKRMDKFDELISKFSDENYVPSIKELRDVEDFINKGVDGGFAGSEERIHLMTDIEGTKEFLQSAFEFEIRTTYFGDSELNDKIEKMEDYHKIRHADTLELASACSMLGEMKTSEIVDSFQAKGAIWDVSLVRDDLFKLSKELRADRDELQENKTDDADDKELKDIKDLLKIVNNINGGFKSSKSEDAADAAFEFASR